MAKRSRRPSKAEDDRNNAKLAADRDRKLFYMHKRRVREAQRVKNEADSALRNAYKLAKSDLGETAKDDIQDSLRWNKKGGEAAVRAELERMVRLASWNGFAIDYQAELFKDAPDQASPSDRGLLAGMNGDEPRPPYDPGSREHQEWMAAWHEGQASIVNLQREKDAEAFEQDADEPDEEEDGAGDDVNGVESLAEEDADDADDADEETDPAPIGDQESTEVVRH